MPIRAILFDLDNTLILEDEATLRSVRAACLLAAGRADVGALEAAVIETAERLWTSSVVAEHGERFGVWWGEALFGDFRGDDEVSRALAAFAPRFRRKVWRDALARVHVSDHTLADDLAAEYRRVRRAGEVIDPEAEPLLASLARDHRLALVTNGSGDVQREKLSRTPFGRYFDAVVVSIEAGVGKPDARIFVVALERVGATAPEAVMVGDSLERDVRGARNADLRSVWIDRGLWDESPIAADATIRTLSDLPAALAALERLSASPRATS